MRTARLPDGRTLEFPDGTPDEVMQTTVRRVLQGDMPQQPQPQAADQGMSLREKGQQAAQGATFGAGDELTAALAALMAKTEPGAQPFGETYRAILEAERGQIAQTQEEHPVASTALQVGGGLLTGGAGASRAAGAKVLQGATTRGGQIAQKIGQSAAAGVPAGALYGAGTAEGGLQERAVGAGEGAALGAAGGVLLRPVAAAVTSTLKQGAKGIRGAVRALTTTQETKANAQIAKTMTLDDTVRTARQNLAEAGPGATIPDVTGESTKLLLEGVAGSPGSRNATVKRVMENLDGSRDRVIGEVRDIFTPGGQTFDETVAGITRAASKEAAPWYARTYATNIDNSVGPLKELLKNSRIKKAMKQAVKDIKDETLDESDPNIDALRRLQREANAENPNMMVWDRTKQELDDLQSAAYNKGRGKRAKNIGDNLAALRDTLDEQVPAYATARKIWAGGQEEVNAFKAGTEVLDGLTRLKTGAKASVALFDDLSDASKKLYRVGLGQDIENRALTSVNEKTGSLASQIANNPAKRKVLENAIPDAAQRKQFMRSLTSQRDFSKNANEVLKNSRTQLRQTLKHLDKASAGTFFSNLIAGQFALSGNQFAQLRLVSSLAGKANRQSDEVQALIGKKLTETRGAELNKTLNEIDRLVRLPKSLREAKDLGPSDVVKFFLDNPDAARKFNETAAGVTAAVMAHDPDVVRRFNGTKANAQEQE